MRSKYTCTNSSGRSSMRGNWFKADNWCAYEKQHDVLCIKPSAHSVVLDSCIAPNAPWNSGVLVKTIVQNGRKERMNGVLGALFALHWRCLLQLSIHSVLILSPYHRFLYIVKVVFLLITLQSWAPGHGSNIRDARIRQARANYYFLAFSLPSGSSLRTQKKCSCTPFSLYYQCVASHSMCTCILVCVASLIGCVSFYTGIGNDNLQPYMYLVVENCQKPGSHESADDICNNPS